MSGIEGWHEHQTDNDIFREAGANIREQLDSILQDDTIGFDERKDFQQLLLSYEVDSINAREEAQYEIANLKAHLEESGEATTEDSEMRANDLLVDASEQFQKWLWAEDIKELIAWKSFDDFDLETENNIKILSNALWIEDQVLKDAYVFLKRDAQKLWMSSPKINVVINDSGNGLDIIVPIEAWWRILSSFWYKVHGDMYETIES